MMSDVEEESILIFAQKKSDEKAHQTLQMSHHKLFDLSVAIQTVKSIHLS